MNAAGVSKVAQGTLGHVEYFIILVLMMTS